MVRASYFKKDISHICLDLNSSTVWTHLNNCDVFEAAKMIDAANILSTRDSVVDPLACFTYFSASSQETLRKLKLTRAQKNDFASVLSLAEVRFM